MCVVAQLLDHDPAIGCEETVELSVYSLAKKRTLYVVIARVSF